MIPQKSKHSPIVSVGAFGGHGVRTSSNDDPLAVRQASLQLVGNSMEELGTPLAIRQEGWRIDRLGHVARENRSRAFHCRVGLMGGLVVQVHHLVGIGTRVVSSRTTGGVYEQRNPRIVTSPAFNASRAGAMPLFQSFSMSETSRTPARIPIAGGSLSARLMTISGCAAEKNRAVCAPDEWATTRTLDSARARMKAARSSPCASAAPSGILLGLASFGKWSRRL